MAVTQDTYRARFKTNVGVGIEQLRIIEQPHRLRGPCVLTLLLAVPKGRCPKPHGDILASEVQGCPEHVVILGIACHGYTGSVIAQKGKMTYLLPVVGASPTTARAALDSLSPRRWAMAVVVLLVPDELDRLDRQAR